MVFDDGTRVCCTSVGRERGVGMRKASCCGFASEGTAGRGVVAGLSEWADGAARAAGRGRVVMRWVHLVEKKGSMDWMD